MGSGDLSEAQLALALCPKICKTSEPEQEKKRFPFVSSITRLLVVNSHPKFAPWGLGESFFRICSQVNPLTHVIRSPVTKSQIQRSKLIQINGNVGFFDYG